MLLFFISEKTFHMWMSDIGVRGVLCSGALAYVAINAIFAECGADVVGCVAAVSQLFSVHGLAHSGSSPGGVCGLSVSYHCVAIFTLYIIWRAGCRAVMGRTVAFLP